MIDLDKGKQIMLDLETLGTKPGCVIASIGAVKFNSTQIYRKFYKTIDCQTALDVGFTVDWSTIKWWFKQNSKAVNELIETPGGNIKDVLLEFYDWCKKDSGKIEIWGNGADFDIPILQAAYDKLKLVSPWGPFQGRCYRTIKNLYPQVQKVSQGTAHNALDDAINQARHLAHIMKYALNNPVKLV